MTNAAVLGSWYVTGIFLGHRTWGTITMTFRTIIHDTSMIKDTICEIGTDCMTSTAIGSGIGMWRARCFAQRACRRYIVAIVTRYTVIGDTGMCKYLR